LGPSKAKFCMHRVELVIHLLVLTITSLHLGVNDRVLDCGRYKVRSHFGAYLENHLHRHGPLYILFLDLIAPQIPSTTSHQGGTSLYPFTPSFNHRILSHPILRVERIESVTQITRATDSPHTTQTLIYTARPDYNGKADTSSGHLSRHLYYITNRIYLIPN